ncbi:alpha/beta hydrolase fold protein [Mytilinidion resinicola]|uniref:Alpha/beta hydrolase fold protein n=1 Tax=Mytilinidion resinicola TaxID=574789 RepID=A0A6A6YRZ6_9PEZI|nr:alpha/beta hydrolase fold protein [Mytilinidion resinicola]KAF2811328.1 alpha/beta hydrolase fold protein [Mytilinidion resinicola]
MNKVSSPPPTHLAASRAFPVSIGTHTLHLAIYGPARTSSTPLTIVFPGAGDVAYSWLPTARIVSATTPILLYDRSGLGLSDDPPPSSPVNAVTAATELKTALANAGLEPPYILCAHSYGAIVAREFLELHESDVAGIVLVDPSGERQSEYFKLPDENIVAVTGALRTTVVTGLRADTILTPLEWAERATLVRRGVDATMKEVGAFVEVCETLGRKRQLERRLLGTKPLSVIKANSKRDFERIYEKGVEVGNGTQEQQRGFRELLDSWDEADKVIKEGQLQLSSNARLIHLSDCGHYVHLVRPQVVADEIRWVSDNLAASGDFSRL